MPQYFLKRQLEMHINKTGYIPVVVAIQAAHEWVPVAIRTACGWLGDKRTMIFVFATLLVISAEASAMNIPGKGWEPEEISSRNRRAVDLTIPRLGDLQPGQAGVLNQNCMYIKY